MSLMVSRCTAASSVRRDSCHGPSRLPSGLPARRALERLDLAAAVKEGRADGQGLLRAEAVAVDVGRGEGEEDADGRGARAILRGEPLFEPARPGQDVGVRLARAAPTAPGK